MMKRKWMASCLAATLCFSTALAAGPTTVQAVSISEVADELMRQHPEIIKQWTDAGASEAQVKAFVNAVAKHVENSGDLTEANIESKFKKAIFDVGFNGHMKAVAAAAVAFDIDLDNPQVPAELAPMRAIIKDAILEAIDNNEDDDNKGGSSGGGGGGAGGGGSNNDDKTDDDEKDTDEKDEDKKDDEDEKTDESDNEDDESNVEPTPEPNSTPVFSDISGHWAEQHIVKMHEAGIVKGTDGKALPNNLITRAEFATLLVNMLDLQGSSPISFADAKPDAWYFEPLSKAVHAGLLKGYNADQIGPNDTITREQMATMVYSAMKIKGVPISTLNELAFTDKDQIAAWAREAVIATNAAGIINGFPDQTFDPKGKATRAQAIVMISILSDL